MKVVKKVRELKSTFFKLEQWCMNHIWARSRIITVPLNRCVDEFGNLYGGNNSHFLVDAVKLLPDEEALKQHLRESYKNNTLESVNDALATSIGHPYGEHYFLPWEDSRVRQLDRFLFSHKIGPTPEQPCSQLRRVPKGHSFVRWNCDRIHVERWKSPGGSVIPF